FMEEAQRLCDRIAVIDRGKVVALDTPAGLIRQATGSTVLSFIPSRPPTGPELTRLAALPGVESVTPPDAAGVLVLHATDDTVTPLISLLAELGITANRLRITETSLDEAFLDLTGQDA
nr:ABC transporter ATP-binding protein [Streptomyces sp. DSM 41633]